MEQDNRSRLANEPVGKLLFKLAVPAVTAQIVNVLYNMVDRIFIGHIPDIGALALTGIGICLPIIMLLTAFAALINMGGAPRASVKMGEKKQDEAENILGNCVTLLIILSVIITAFFLIFGENLLFVFGASENTIGYAWDYLQIYIIGTIFVQCSIGLNTFISAQGFAKTSMLTVLIGAVLNIILDPIFIFVFGMGVRGAAFATVISQGISAIWVIHFLTGKKTILKIKRKHMRLKKTVFLPCLALGVAPFIMQATESILIICFNSSLLRYGGDLAVGAMTILSSVRQLFMMPLFGLTQGAQPITSFNYGAKNAERVKKTFLLLIKVCFGYTFIMWALVMIFPRNFALLFNKDPELVNFTVWALRTYMAVGFVLGVQVACQQTFIAIGNAKTSLFVAIFRKIILLIPLIYILPLVLSNQVLGVFIAEPIADIISVCVTVVLFTMQFKSALKQLREENPIAASANT